MKRPVLALSIKQPWAWLIVRPDLTDPERRAVAARSGVLKNVENRTWPTDYRGPFWIHAGKGMTKYEYRDAFVFVEKLKLCDLLPQRLVLPDFDFFDNLRGGIVGSAWLVDCVRESDSHWFVGDYGFVLAGQKPFPFTPCQGALGFFKPQRPEAK